MEQLSTLFIISPSSQSSSIINTHFQYDFTSITPVSERSFEMQWRSHKVRQILVYLIQICFPWLFIYCLDFNKRNRLLLLKVNTGQSLLTYWVYQNQEKMIQDCIILNVMIWKQNSQGLMENTIEKHIL